MLIQVSAGIPFRRLRAADGKPRRVWEDPQCVVAGVLFRRFSSGGEAKRDAYDGIAVGDTGGVVEAMQRNPMQERCL